MARRIPLYRKLIYSAVIVLGFFGFLELGLRAVGLGKPPVIGELQFGYDTGIPRYDSDGIESEGQLYTSVPLFEPHHKLFWQPIANTPFTGPGGFRRPEPPIEPDTDNDLTIIILGDSCSFLGEATYAARLNQLLSTRTDQRVRIFNASCPGYSSAQGLMRLKQLDHLKPDVVLVYFGWNDHWRSLNGCTDQELIDQNNFALQSQQLLRYFHFYWLVYAAFSPVPRIEVKQDAPVRVPLPDYEKNLQAIAEHAQSLKARTLFLTAPTTFAEGALPEWSLGFFGQYYQMSATQVADIPKTHQLYNDVTRRMDHPETHSGVLDLESMLGRNPTLFRSDCIHLSEEGHQAVAAAIAEDLPRRWPELFKP